jgi:hypothetical protein
VITSLQDNHVIALYDVDEPVFFVDSPRPRTSERVPQRFGFSNTVKRIARDVVKESVDPTHGRAV